MKTIRWGANTTAKPPSCLPSADRRQYGHRHYGHPGRGALGGIENTFTPATITSKVTEDFNGSTGGECDQYRNGFYDVTRKLVTYRVNEAGRRIGGAAEIPNFTLGENWVKYGDCYYTLPVAPNGQPRR